ncbi:MAG: nitroreductase [Flavobacteriales bacterium]|nr:MAG: nitroreductase [Flavobacteriales bacterium]
MSYLDKIIQSRRSTYLKDFNQDDISEVEIEELLNLALYAPSHKKTKPWRFVVLRGEENISKLGEELTNLYLKHTPSEAFSETKHKGMKAKVMQANTAIAIVVNFSGKVPEWEEKVAVGMAVQNLWLKATEMNIGGYWSSPKFIFHLNDFLGLAKHQKCIGLFYLGRSTDKPTKSREEDNEDFVTYF